MADHPVRRSFGSPEDGPDHGDPGWGSPMPAEYGSLTAFLPPVSDPWGTPVVREAADSPPDTPPRPATSRPSTRRTGRLSHRLRQAVQPPPAPRPAEPVDERVADDPVGPAVESDPVTAVDPGSEEPFEAVADSGGEAFGADPVGERDDDAAGAWSDDGQEDHVFDRGGDEYSPDPSRVTYGAGPAGAVTGVGGPTPLGMAAVPSGTETMSGPPLTSLPGGGSMSRRQRRRERRWVESRWVIRHLDIWTVLKVSVIFYLIVLAAVVVASVLLWYLADSFGALHSIEKSVKTLFDLKSFTLHPKTVAMWTAAGGAVLAVGGTIVNLLAALVYNLISDLVGGISARVVTEAE